MDLKQSNEEKNYFTHEKTRMSLQLNELQWRFHSHNEEIQLNR